MNIQLVSRVPLTKSLLMPRGNSAISLVEELSLVSVRDRIGFVEGNSKGNGEALTQGFNVIVSLSRVIQQTIGIRN